MAHALTADEKLSLHKVVGIALGFAGVVALVGVEALLGSEDAVLPILACLGAALSYGFANVFGRRFRPMRIEPTVGAFGQLMAATVMMVPLALVTDAPWKIAVPDAGVWVAMIGLALLSTALAYIIFFHLLATVGATNTSLVTFLIPVSAILLGVLFLGEHLSWVQMAGMALIASGLVAIDGRLWALS